MTSGTLEKVYRLRDPRLTIAMKGVLSYYAYRAYYMDGRGAWPALGTVAESVGCDKKTVMRSIDALIGLGYMRLAPDQSWNVRDSETGDWKRKSYRTKVYDVLTENFRTMTDEGESERRAERTARDDADTTPATPGDEGYQNVTPHEKPGNKPIPRGTRMSPLERERKDRGDILSDEGYQNVTQLTNNQQNPSAPTGHLPAGGESRPNDEPGFGGEAEPMPAPCAPDDWDAETPDDGDGWVDADDDPVTVPEPTPADRVDAFLARIAVERAENGLTTRPPTDRDRQAVRRLAERLEHAGMDPWPRMAEVLEHAIRSDFQAKRVDSGRRFARLYDELANDLACDRRHAMRAALKASAAAGPDRSVRDETPVPPEERPDHRHTAGCRHVRDLIDGPRARAAEPSYTNRHDHAAQVAGWLNGHTIRETLDLLVDALRRERAEHDRDMAELAELRRANDGSMIPQAIRRASGARA